MIEWKQEAIEAARKALGIKTIMHDMEVRAALDAAVRAQGDLVVVPYDTFKATMAGVRAAAIEECAKIAEGFPRNRDWVPGSLYDTLRKEVATSIRALAEKDGGNG